ncbi:MAG TPA: response regulator [Thermodesulfobacteriota bacterium]|nr:response regulator [Thermodesulfobacteriota bacterium]
MNNLARTKQLILESLQRLQHRLARMGKRRYRLEFPNPGQYGLAHYIFSLSAVAATSLLYEGISRLVGYYGLPPFILFFPVIMLAALLAGLWPGLLATAAAALLVEVFFLKPFFLEPRGQIPSAANAAEISLALFVGICVLLSFVAELLRQTRHRLEHTATELSQANKQLQQEIAEHQQDEEALHKSEEDLKWAQTVAQTGSWRLDFQRNELLWSDENHRIFGIPQGTPLSYDRFLEIVHPDDRNHVNERWSAVLQGEPYDVEHRIIVGDTIKWVRERAELEFDQEGNLQSGFGTTQDITERKLVEERLKRSKERFELLAENSSRLLAAENPQTIVNDLCTRVMAHLDCQAFFNYLADEDCDCLTLNAWAGIPEDVAWKIRHLPYGSAACGCAAQEGVGIVAENIPETYDPRTELVRSLGILAYACHPLYAAGKVIGTISFGTRTQSTFTEDDLSLMKAVADQVALAFERKQTEKSLHAAKNELEEKVQERTAAIQRSNIALEIEMAERKLAQQRIETERKRFYDVLETLPAYLILLTPDYHVSFANRFFRERFGEDCGQRCYEYLFGRSEPCEVCETYKVLKTGESAEWEWTGPDSRNYHVFDFPFTDTDGSSLILEMGIDVTEQKQAEQALQESTRVLRELSTKLLCTQETERKLLAMELHDSIAASLAATRMKLGVILQRAEPQCEPLKAEIASAAELIHETNQNVRRLMGNLRPAMLDDLGLIPALRNHVRRFEEQYPGIAVSISAELAGEAIPERLRIVLFRIAQEALTNIGKHSGATRADLSLHKEGERLWLEVRDNGRGFDIAAAYSARHGETGFGLSSMKERTGYSGGMLTIESAPEKGTVIRASWPLGEADPVPIPAAPCTTVNRLERDVLRTILLVEDNKIFRHAFRDNLLICFPGVHIAEADECRQALQIIQESQPQLIFMDINLPGENGLTLTRTVKERAPATRVIVLTSYDTPEYREAATRAGADAFVVKGSLNMDEIAALIRRMIAV